jgi:hypothetical protein
MSVEEPSLNKYQLELLKLLYTFRFATVDLITINLGLKNRANVDSRLNNLRRLGYISRKFSTSYRLIGKPAVYYLQPKAFPILRKRDNISTSVLRNMYKNSKASQRFINHSLSIFKAYISLKGCYKSKLWFFTGNDLKLAEFEYFPKPLPDGFLSMKFSSSVKGKRKYFFLIFCSSHIPSFVHLKQLKSLIDYRSSEEWEQTTKTSLSGILVLTDSIKFKHSLIEKMAKLLYNEGLDEDLSYYITTQNELTQISSEDIVIWQAISEPTVMRQLEEM